MCCHKSTLLILFSLLASFAASAFAQEKLSAVSRADNRSVSIDQTVLTIDSRPFFVRSIQHNGESFSFLKELGFNAIQLSAPPTQKERSQASELAIWLICPPPSSTKYQTIDSSYDCVLAWSVGERRSGRDIQVIRRTIDDTRVADKSNRPVVANINSHWSSIGSEVDVVSVGIHSIGTDFPAAHYSNFVKQVGQLVNKPIWADIQTELSPGLLKQVAGFLGKVPSLPIEHQQLKFQLYEAICGGARGVRFLSKSKLDETDPVSRLRASGIRWLLYHCQQIESWVAGGLVESIQSSDSLEVHSIRLPGSKLVIVQRPTGFEQWTCGSREPATTQFSSYQNNADRAYFIDERGSTLIPEYRSNAQANVQIPNCPYAACILLTQDARAVQTARRYIVADPILLQNRFDLTQQSLAYFSLVEQQIAATGYGFPILGTARVAAETSLQNAQRMLQAGNNNEAIKLIEVADAKLATARYSLLNQQFNRLGGKVSSPLISHFGLISHHLNLGNQMAAATWNPNSLPGGDFEDLGQMMQSGWENRKEESDFIDTKVELQKNAAIDGTYGLNMTASSKRSVPTLVQVNPLWVNSSAVQVKKGQLIRIHGFANVGSVAGSMSGATVTDSIGQDDLALRFEKTPGWQEFTVYRTAPRNGKFSITLAMTGIGSAMFDEITIRTLDRPDSSEQANSSKNEIK